MRGARSSAVARPTEVADPGLVRTLAVALSIRPDLSATARVEWLTTRLGVVATPAALDAAPHALRADGALDANDRPNPVRLAELAEEKGYTPGFARRGVWRNKREDELLTQRYAVVRALLVPPMVFALLTGSILSEFVGAQVQSSTPTLQPTSAQTASGQTPSPVATSFATVTMSTPLPTSSTSAGPVSLTATPQSSWMSRWLPSDPEETRKIVLTAILTLLTTLFVVFFKQIAAGARKSINWLWTRVRIEHMITRRYCRNLAGELRTIQILSMPEEKPLETFFIPLRLVGWIEPELRDNGGSVSPDPISLQEALQQYDYIAILGNPGAGKTTLSSQAAAAVADGTLTINEKHYFPIFIQLRRLKDLLQGSEHQTKSLLEFACDGLGHHGFPNSEGLLARKLATGTCLLVLDGFDELSDREGTLQQRLASKVKDFVSAAPPGNRIVLTSRSAGYVPAWFNGFRVLEMTELTLDQAKLFIAGWFGDAHVAQGRSLQKALEDNQRLQILTANPLMLAIVCFVFGTKRVEEAFLPKRRVDLYDRCVGTLISDWDKSRGVKRDAQFRPDEIETVLSYVAYDALRQQRIDFNRRDLLSLIRAHLPKAGRRYYEDEDFLTEVSEHTGLFKEKGQDTIGFLHLTFQEYLAAQSIANKVLAGIEKRDVRSEIGEVLTNAINPAWSEPIALAAGILRGRSELVTALFDAYKDRRTPEIQLLLATCLRDADLENLAQDPSYLLKQDEILGQLVQTAAEAKA